MKFTIDIDCTPQEARAFLGLPDIAPIQESLMEEIESRLRKGLELTDPETLFKLWMPAMKGWEDLMRSMVAPFAAAARPDDD